MIIMFKITELLFPILLISKLIECDLVIEVHLNGLTQPESRYLHSKEPLCLLFEMAQKEKTKQSSDQKE